MSRILSDAGRAAVQQFFTGTAQAYGVTPPAGAESLKFTVTPSMMQTLQEKIVLDGFGFLGMIRTVPVSELTGEKIFMDADVLVTGRTNTATTDRTPSDPSNLTNQIYTLVAQEVEVAISYATIDSWAKFPNFAGLWNGVIRKAIANDRVKIGFNGTSAAAATNKVTSPNGEDVAKGWLQLIREYDSGAQYVDGTGAVELGSTDYPNLDYLVATVKARLPELYRNSPDLVAMVGADLASVEEQAFWKEAGRNAERKEALDRSSGRLLRNYGGLPSYSPAYFPEGAILVTSFDNLAWYYQDTSVRRTIIDWAKRNRYEDYSSINAGYVVQDERKTSLLDHVAIAEA